MDSENENNESDEMLPLTSDVNDEDIAMEESENEVSCSYKVVRSAYTYKELNEHFQETLYVAPYLTRLKTAFRKYLTTKYILGRLISYFPFIGLRRFYNRTYILSDIIAGITTCIFHIPQGLAYGLLAGLRPINGLYTSFFPVFIYFFLATSRHVSMGTFSLMSLMIAEPVGRLLNKYEAGVPQYTNMSLNDGNYTMRNETIVNPEYENAMYMYSLQVAIVVTLLAGIVQAGLGFFHLGFISNYLSDPLVGGFTFSGAIHVLTSQLPAILGYSVPRYSGPGRLIYTYIALCKNIGKINWATVIVSVCCMVVLHIVREYISPRLKKKCIYPIPIELIVVIVSTLISYLVNLNEQFGVVIVGYVPQGFPTPMVPNVAELAKDVAGDAISIAIVGFAMTTSLAKIFSLKYNYQCDYDQELLALGLSNIFGSFFQCHVASGALARTSVVVAVGMKSQLASLLSCGLMLIVILVAGPLFQPVPNCVLSSIIVISLKGMLIQIRDLKKLWTVSDIDCTIWVVTALSVIFLDITFGLIVGFVFSLITVIFRTQNPEGRLLGNLPDTDLYRDPNIYKDAEEIPGIKIFRYDASPYFANAENFKKKLYEGVLDPTLQECDLEDEEREKRKNCQHLVLDCSTWAFIDSVGARVLKEIVKAYNGIGISIYLTVCKADVRYMFEKLREVGQTDELLDNLFPTVHDAVLHAKKRQKLAEIKEIAETALGSDSVAAADHDDEDAHDGDKNSTRESSENVKHSDENV